MSLQSTDKPTQAPAKHRITAKVRTAIEAMVWQGLPRAEAAEHAGISEHGLYKAFRTPPVKAAYLEELEVLRTSERSRNFHTLIEVRNQTANQMARVNAIAAMNAMDDQQLGNGNARQMPGLTIVIEGNAHLTQVHQTEAKSLIDMEAVRTDGTRNDD